MTQSDIAYRANDLISKLRGRTGAYHTPYLMVPFGDDFKFQAAATQFNNMDQLISYINTHNEMGVSIRYGA